MDSEILLEAVGGIRDEYIFSAETRLGYTSLLSTPKAYKKKPITLKRKAIVSIAAAIILLLGSFTTAMAVSKEFRQAVFKFFNISVPEAVPDIRPDTQESDPDYAISGVDLNEMIHAKYVWIPGWSHSKYGIFHCSNDGIIYKRGSHFNLYGEKDGKLIPIETQTTNMDYDWNGHKYHIEFEWGAYENNLSFAYVADNGSNGWYFDYLLSNPSDVMITLEYVLPCENDEVFVYSSYPMIFDLKNQMIIDVLNGCGVENLPNIANAVFSNDYTKALLAQEDGTLYYCDINAKCLHQVDELSGRKTGACTFVGDNLICWALDDCGHYDCWSINLSSFERKEVFEDIPMYDKAKGFGLVFISGFDTMHHSGYSYAGSSFALNVQEDKSVYVIDFSTGDHIIIDGFSWSDIWNVSSDAYMECVDNPAGTRVLIIERDSNSAGYGYLGVIDYVSKSYVRLARENFSVNEQAIYWFDEDRIIIDTDGDETGRGVYIYTFRYP